jgi:hypothetical protein
MPIHSVVASEQPGILPDVQREILRIVAGVEYGSVEIVIHGRQVVQIETRQKKRFEADGKAVR